jgi:hypothetical protein
LFAAYLNAVEQPPDERVEPQDDPQDFLGENGHCIVAADVSEFVADGRALLGFADPVIVVGRLVSAVGCGAKPAVPLLDAGRIPGCASLRNSA